MGQDDFFWKGEGDQWFTRNRSSFESQSKVEWVGRVVEALDLADKTSSILDVGCANGWRLAKLADRFFKDRPVRCVGVDVSEEALRDGREKFPAITFIRGSASEIPLTETFDLVVVYSVLHWVARENLAKAVAEIDRVVKDGGVLVLADFLPNGPTRVPYHHLPGKEVFTYKQDYPKVFEALGTYRQAMRFLYDARTERYSIEVVSTENRAVCSALVKSLHGFYWG